jgi:hypothetical protein
VKNNSQSPLKHNGQVVKGSGMPSTPASSQGKTADGLLRLKNYLKSEGSAVIHEDEEEWRSVASSRVVSRK